MHKPKMFYCCDNTLNTTDAFSNRAMMLSAGLVWTCGNDDFNFTVPECDTLFIDSGGFQATSAWGMEYPYSTKRLFDWAESLNADYVACPDFACEPWLHDSTVKNRIHRTLEAHAEAVAIYEDYGYSFQILPVLQGYFAEQYKECIKLYKREGLIRDYMAVGTVCKRDSTNATHNVMHAIEQQLPNTEFHMFGMTLNAWKDRRIWGRFRSADTAAWNWGGGSIAEKKELLSEYSRRIDEIRQSMAAQQTLF